MGDTPERAGFVIDAEVALYLENLCSDAEIDDFSRQLERVRRSPLESSEALADPSISRYMLRRFRFGGPLGKVAIFEFDPGRFQVRVLKCRLERPREKL